MSGRRSSWVVAAGLLLLAALPCAEGDAAEGQSLAKGMARLKAMNVAFEPERLVQFAGQGDAVVVEAFLEAGMPADSTEPRRESTALIHAAANGHARIVDRLLGAGAAVDRADRDGTTALTAACYFARPAVVELLLAKGASAAGLAKDGGTSALDAAIWGGNARVVSLLLAAGADAVAETRETPPLVRAAYAGREEILKALLVAKPPLAVMRRAQEAARRARHPGAEALIARAMAP